MRDIFSKAAIVAGMSLALLGGCDGKRYVTGTAAATASVSSKLALNPGDVATNHAVCDTTQVATGNYDSTSEAGYAAYWDQFGDYYGQGLPVYENQVTCRNHTVTWAKLVGIYVGCDGHDQPTTTSYEGWEMFFHQGNGSEPVSTTGVYNYGPDGQTHKAVKVAQNDSTCTLRATGIVRKLDNGSVETMSFHGVTPGSNSTPDDTLEVGTEIAMGVPIHEGFQAENLAMAVREDIQSGASAVGKFWGGTPGTDTSVYVPADYQSEDDIITTSTTSSKNNDGKFSALVNIAGTNTGTGSGPAFTQDFEVTVITGSTAKELLPSSANSDIKWSRNAYATHLELPAPNYVLNPDINMAVLVNPAGYITPSSHGNFNFVFPTGGTFSQYGTEYLISGAANADLSTLPLGPVWQAMDDAERYNTLFTRWQKLRTDRHRKAVQIDPAGDRSFFIPIMTAFPLGTRMFNKVTTLVNFVPQSSWQDYQNHLAVIIRYKADGQESGDNVYDGNSGVISYQAFEIFVNAPPTDH